MKYVIAIPMPPQSDPLRQYGGTQYVSYATVLEVENWLKTAQPASAEKALVYQQVPVDYRGPIAMVKTFGEPKPKKKASRT